MRSKNFLRFCMVGLINTAIDVPLFLILHANGFSILVANIISTTLALIASFVLNYKYTFRSRRLNASKILTYVSVTLVGLWLLQPVVIRGVLDLLVIIPVTQIAITFVGHADVINNTFAKLASIGVTLVWNYAWYSQVVFRDSKRRDQFGIIIKEEPATD